MKRSLLWTCVWFLALTVPAFPRGNKCIPQIADGTGADGTKFRTKFDLVNISPAQAISGTFTLRFYHQDGTLWPLSFSVNSGPLQNANSYAITLSPRQKIRVETLGLSASITGGYAILEDNETKTYRDQPPATFGAVFSMDFVVGISVFYEVSNATGVVDTVSVSVPEPTALSTFPVQVTQSQQVYTGIAIVNLAGVANSVEVDLYPSGTGTTAPFTLQPGQQRAEFFHQNLFPFLATQDFSGIAEISATGPVAILGLLQSQTANGVQYATLATTDREALRRDTYLWVPMATYSASQNGIMPADVDYFTVDYFELSGGGEDYPWDFVFTSVSSTSRRLDIDYGYGFASLGNLNDTDFDAVSLPQLKGLSYSTSSIDLSNGSSALAAINNTSGQRFAFAVITDLGNYAKLRLVGTSSYTGSDGNPYLDLLLEVYVFR